MYAEEGTKFLEIILRGGWKNISEDLLEGYRQLVNELNREGCLMVITEERVLSENKASTMSIQLDTRNGQIQDYDRSTNPYDQPRKELTNDAFEKIVMRTAFETTTTVNIV